MEPTDVSEEIVLVIFRMLATEPMRPDYILRSTPSVQRPILDRYAGEVERILMQRNYRKAD